MLLSDNNVMTETKNKISQNNIFTYYIILYAFFGVYHDNTFEIMLYLLH